MKPAKHSNAFFTVVKFAGAQHLGDRLSKRLFFKLYRWYKEMLIKDDPELASEIKRYEKDV